jgi:hypothetical protein
LWGELPDGAVISDTIGPNIEKIPISGHQESHDIGKIPKSGYYQPIIRCPDIG